MKALGAKDFREQAMLEKDFLENYPLYKWFNVRNVSRLNYLQYSPSIKMSCPTCESEQTFTFKDYDQNDWMKGPLRAESFSRDVYKDQTLKVNYECKGCHSFPMTFTFRFSSDGARIQKIGQFPPFVIHPTKEVSAFLGDYAVLFKKGLVCESQSYGIGSFSYYRRIVELEIERLLKEIESQVRPEDAESFGLVFKEVKESHYAKDKIDLISGVIPAHLKPGGANPIGILYRVLSEGIHTLSDEECLEKAKAIRETLESLIYLLSANKEAIAKLSNAAKQLLSTKDHSASRPSR